MILEFSSNFNNSMNLWFPLRRSFWISTALHFGVTFKLWIDPRKALRKTRKQNIHCEVSKWLFSIRWWSEQHGLSSSAVLTFLLRTWALQVIRMISGFVQDSWRKRLRMELFDCRQPPSLQQSQVLQGKAKRLQMEQTYACLDGRRRWRDHGHQLWDCLRSVSPFCPGSITLLPFIPQEQRLIPISSVHLLYIYSDGSHLQVLPMRIFCVWWPGQLWVIWDHLSRCSRTIGMWHWGAGVSGHGGDGVGLNLVFSEVFSNLNDSGIQSIWLLHLTAHLPVGSPRNHRFLFKCPVLFSVVVIAAGEKCAEHTETVKLENH